MKKTNSSTSRICLFIFAWVILLAGISMLSISVYHNSTIEYHRSIYETGKYSLSEANSAIGITGMADLSTDKEIGLYKILEFYNENMLSELDDEKATNNIILQISASFSLLGLLQLFVLRKKAEPEA